MNTSSFNSCLPLSYKLSDEPKPSLEAFFFILYSVCGLAAISGNTLVLVAVYKTPNLQTVSNKLLCSLAFADLLVGILHCPFYCIMVAIRADSSGATLKLDFFLWTQTLFSTTLNLSAVSGDRYMAIKWPLKYALTSERVYTGMIVFIWISSFILAVPTLVFKDLTTLSAYTAFCAFITLILPSFIITWTYFEIVKISKRHARIAPSPSRQLPGVENTIEDSLGNFNQGRIAPMAPSRFAKNRKAVATFAIIASMLVVTFTPNLFFAVWFSKAESCEKGYHIFQIWTWSLIVLCSGSAMNPIIYGLRNREFRSAFKRILRSFLNTNN
ncbi:dopamine receptor 1 [Nematostella vectensis]|uniref:dopamine receptor 1 n=1 Tax=Nematostella vectensis TaxID=45351 RepID=UPI00138FAB7B|nr:dopamine receptor 1 [Nematostella vectensis]